MIPITEEEDKTSEVINPDFVKVINFYRRNECLIKFHKDLRIEICGKDGELIQEISFSDLFYPKNLLRYLEERMKEN